MSYKNTHKKVQKLIRLELIERISNPEVLEDKETEKGAKYYKLSEEGFFAIYYDSAAVIQPSFMDAMQPKRIGDKMDIKMLSDRYEEYIKEIYKNHKDCLLFRVFLSPWIDIETVQHLEARVILNINDFLYDCCKALERLFFNKWFFPLVSEVRNDKGPFSLDELHDDIIDVDNSPILSFTSRIFSLGTKTVEVKRKSKNSIMISKPNDRELVNITYREEDSEVEFTWLDEPMDKVSIPASLVQEMEDALGTIDGVIHNVHFQNLYFRAIFSILMEMGAEENNNLAILKKDPVFKHRLEELNEIYRSNADLLLDR